MATTEPRPSAAEKLTCENTDRELWREREGDYYADSIHVTESGGIGINCGGYVVVKSLREWHKLASRHSGQAVDRQEWTERLLRQLDPAGRENDAETERRRKLLNAALAAERQRREEAELERRNAGEEWSVTLDALTNQLLSALAAIEKILAADASRDELALSNAIEDARHVSLSLLRDHDAELTEKVRKPLESRMKELQDEIDRLNAR